MPVHKSGKKNRKWGRNSSYCTNYRASQKQERSHAKKMWRHLVSHVNDMHCRQKLMAMPLMVLSYLKIPVDHKQWPQPTRENYDAV